MKIKRSIPLILKVAFFAFLPLVLLTGCGTVSKNGGDQNASASGQHTIAKPSVTEQFQAMRIKAGSGDNFKDSAGNLWLADRGFTGGDTVDRPELVITNAADQRIYQSERYSMTQFSQALPNGKYVVKLHFCETFDGITGPGERVFTFNVAGREFKDFDVWVKAGGGQHAYVESVPVEITDGKLLITFTPEVENPQINGIEILPAP